MKLLVVLFIIIDAHVSSAFFEPQPMWKSKSWAFQSDHSTTFTESNYSEKGGIYEKLPQNGQFLTHQSLLTTRYNWSRRFATDLGLQIGYSQLRNDSVTSDRGEINGSQLGFQWLMSQSWVRALLRVDGFLTFAPIHQRVSHPLTQDGANFFSPKLYLFKRIQKFTPFVMAGVYLPDQGLAVRGLWRVGFQHLFRSLLWGADLGGYAVLSQDSLTDRPNERILIPTNASGGSLVYHSLNPTLLEMTGWIGFQASQSFSIKAGLGKTLTGSNNVEGLSALLTLIWNSTSQSHAAKNLDARSPVERKALNKESDGFEVQTEEDPLDGTK